MEKYKRKIQGYLNSFRFKRLKRKLITDVKEIVVSIVIGLVFSGVMAGVLLI